MDDLEGSWSVRREYRILKRGGKDSQSNCWIYMQCESP